MREGQIFKTVIGGREVTVETGRYAEQANGHCIVKCGDTIKLTIEGEDEETAAAAMQAFLESNL